MNQISSSDLHDAIEQLREPEEFPAEAIGTLRADWEQAAPLLLDALQGDIDLYIDALPDPESEIEEINEDFDLPEFDDLLFQAAYLFAQFKYRPAMPELLRILELDLTTDILGDFLFEGLPRCLAACSGGDATALREVLKDTDADDYARTAAWSAMLCLVAWGELPVEVAIEDLQARLRDPDEEAGFLLGTLAMSVAKLPVNDFCLALARKIIAEGRADADAFSLVEFDAERKRFKPETWREELLELQDGPIEDAAAEIEPWFSEDDEDEYDDDGNWIPPEPVEQLKSDKVGRNDPCPCGSGKKHKKCCGKEE